MNHAEILAKVTSIIASFAPHATQDKLAESTGIVDELGVNSARFVDIVLELEDQFGISIDDSSMDKITTIGAAVDVVESLLTSKVLTK